MTLSKSLIRPGMIFIPFILGLACPAAHHFHWLIRWLLIGMLYLVCLQLEVRQFKPTPPHWKILAANILMGVVPFLLLSFAGSRELALAAFFIGVAPTANAAPVIMSFLNGRSGFVVTAFVITNLGVSLSLFLLLPLVTGNLSLGFVMKIMNNLLLVIGLPVLLAAITRGIYPAARKWSAKCRNVSFGAWSLMLFVIAADAGYFFRMNPDVPKTLILKIALISLIICGLNFLIGAWLGGRRLARECSQSLGQKNTSFIIYIASTFANPAAALGPVFYVLWHNSWNALQMFRYDRRKLFRNRWKP